MNAVDKIKAAAAKLHPDEQFEVFRWWIESDGFRQRQLAALKQDIAKGIDQLESGRHQSYDDSDVMQLADEISRNAQARLAKERKLPGK